MAYSLPWATGRSLLGTAASQLPSSLVDLYRPARSRYMDARRWVTYIQKRQRKNFYSENSKKVLTKFDKYGIIKGDTYVGREDRPGANSSTIDGLPK